MRVRHLGSTLVFGTCVALALSGCQRSSTSSQQQEYSVAATISGLQSSGLVLSVLGSDVAITQGQTTVLLAAALVSGTNYTVRVRNQPVNQSCSVANGSGAIAAANVANVVVTCANQSFALGGSLSGLDGPGLVLSNGPDTLPVDSGATAFTMPTAVAYGSGYEVMVQTQPPGMSCRVNQGTGTMPASAVIGVAVTCTDQPFAIGGSVIGLGDLSGLVLVNGSDLLTVPRNAAFFTMPTTAPFGSSYEVRVQASPAGLSCSVGNASGRVGASNITNVVVTCSDQSYALGGTISGLTAAGLVLSSGSDVRSVPSGATAFTMTDSVAYTGNYNVVVRTNPTGLTCSVAQGVGTMGPMPFTGVTVTCSPLTETIGGSISGLSLSGLILLDNGADATEISANATSFTMHTSVAYGTSYDVSVGTQPYGISVGCTVSGASGVATADVNTVAISCAPVNPVQTAIAGYFQSPVGVARDTSGNLYVTDQQTNEVRKLPYSSATHSYGAPVRVASGLKSPMGVAVDAAGNVYVANSNDNAVVMIPYSSGGYGAPINLGSGFSQPVGVAVDASGNVYVADSGNGAVEQIPFSQGTYGTPIVLASGFLLPFGIAVDAAGNVYVSDGFSNEVVQIPYGAGAYGTPVTLGSSFDQPAGIAVDASGNVYVINANGNDVEQIPYNAGTGYGTPVTIASGFNQPYGVALDPAGSLYVGDRGNSVVKEVPNTGGSFGSPVTVGAGLGKSLALVVDAAGNVFLADNYNGAVKELIYGNGAYGAAAVTVASGLSSLYALTQDSAGNVFVLDPFAGAIIEIPYTAGSYGAPTTVMSGFYYPLAITVDAADNLYVVGGSNTLYQVPYSNGTYGPPVALASGFAGPQGVAVDAAGNIYVGNFIDNDVKKVPFSGGIYGAPMTIGSGFSRPVGVAVDAQGNVYVADNNGVKEIPYANGTYGAPISLGSGFVNPTGVALDTQGRLYVVDETTVWKLTP